MPINHQTFHTSYSIRKKKPSERILRCLKMSVVIATSRDVFNLCFYTTFVFLFKYLSVCYICVLHTFLCKLSHQNQVRAQTPKHCCLLSLLTDMLQLGPWMHLDTLALFCSRSALNTVCVAFTEGFESCWNSEWRKPFHICDIWLTVQWRLIKVWERHH